MEISKYLSYVFEPVRNKLNSTYLLVKHRNSSSNLTIDWNWESTPFNRVALVGKLLSKFSNPHYLEIGCANNVLFDSVSTDYKVGIDPEKGGNVRATSDYYFSKNKDKFDVVFIDGLHEHAQVRRDTENAIKNINGSGYIALHDMLPADWISAYNPRLRSGTWNGDVWKLAFELYKTPELDFKIVKIDQGVGVIRVRDSSQKIVDLNKVLNHQGYEYYYNHLAELPIITWSEFTDWL